MTARYCEIEINRYGEEGGEMVEGVSKFKYLGQNLDQTDGDWPAVSQNIMRARLVCRVGSTADTGRGGTQVISNVLQDGGTSSTIFCI